MFSCVGMSVSVGEDFFYVSVCLSVVLLCIMPVSSVCLSVTCVCVFPYVTGSPGVCLLYVVCCKYRDKATTFHPF